MFISILGLPEKSNPFYVVVNIVKTEMNLFKNNRDLKQGKYVEIEKKEDIEGTWCQMSENNEGEDICYLAQIEKESITIYVFTNNFETQTLTWAGTFNTDFDIREKIRVVSERYKVITDRIEDASHEETKEFYYENGLIKFIGKSLGNNSNIELKKWSVDLFRVLKFSNDRKPEFNNKTNNKIDFFGYKFEYPAYFDIKDERSTAERIVFSPSNNKSYAELSFREREFENLPNEEEFYDNIYLFSKMNEADIYCDDEDVISSNIFLVGGNEAIQTMFFTETGIRINTCIIKDEGKELLTVGIEYTCSEQEDKSQYDYITDYDSIISNAYVIK